MGRTQTQGAGDAAGAGLDVDRRIGALAEAVHALARSQQALLRHVGADRGRTSDSDGGSGDGEGAVAMTAAPTSPTPLPAGRSAAPDDADELRRIVAEVLR